MAQSNLPFLHSILVSVFIRSMKATRTPLPNRTGAKVPRAKKLIMGIGYRHENRTMGDGGGNRNQRIRIVVDQMNGIEPPPFWEADANRTPHLREVPLRLREREKENHINKSR